MFSLSAIPEPSNNAPKPDAAEAVHQPLSAVAVEDQPVAEPVNRPTQKQSPDAEQQVDSVAVLLVLLIAGALLRLVLGLLGPLQGIASQHIDLSHHNARELLAGRPADAYPLFDLIALGISKVGIPAWSLVVLGSLLTLVAIPAAFVVGQTLTGRRSAGTVAAAIVAVHPAVLAAANSFAGASIALSLVTIGLAALCLVEKRSGACVLTGGFLLGLAALAAPLCWIVGATAGPLTYKLARGKGAGKAFALGVLVVLLGVLPAGVYRALLVGQDADAIFAEFSANNAAAVSTNELERLLVSTTDPSFEELGLALHLPLGDAGRLSFSKTETTRTSQQRDVVADTLADGWLLVNAALAGFAAISIGVMLVRRRWAEAFVLTLPLAALALCTLQPGEVLRLPLLTLVGTLSVGLLATRSVPLVDEAMEEAKRLARQAKREEKERAKQERELSKHKESLYAFDKPAKTKRPRKQPSPLPATDQGILSQHDEAAPAMPGRPI